MTLPHKSICDLCKKNLKSNYKQLRGKPEIILWSGNIYNYPCINSLMLQILSFDDTLSDGVDDGTFLHTDCWEIFLLFVFWLADVFSALTRRDTIIDLMFLC